MAKIAKLSNQHIRLEVDSQGAQMTSLKLKEDDLEYLWTADSEYWGRHAPILFPIVGKLKDDQYQLNGQSFDLTQHGFARDSEFELIEKTEDQLVYRLSSNPATLEKYPYQFELDLSYELVENEVKIKYRVKNKDEQKMYFSIGAHPGFNWPLEAGEKKHDYYLEFEKAEKVAAYYLEEGLLTNEHESFLVNSKVKNLIPELFNNDALIFKNLSSEEVSLKSKQSAREVTVSFEGFPYLGIWSKSPEAPFICIEPWYGIADLKDSKGNLKEKKGINSIDPGAEFVCEHSIKIK